MDRREYEKKIFTDSESVLFRGAVCRAAKSMAVNGTMAQRHDMIDDSVQLSNLPHIAWVKPLALPNNNNYALAKSSTRVHYQ